MREIITIILIGLLLVFGFFQANESTVVSLFNENVSISFNGDVNKAVSLAEPWMNPIITREELKAIDWVKANTAPRTVFMSDIFGGEFLMANLREGTEGGDWAIIPNVVERMSDVQNNFYGASDSKKAWETAKKYDAEYVWAPNRQVFAGFSWVSIPEFLDDEQYFEKVFDNGARVYKIK